MPFEEGLTPGKYPTEELMRSRIMELAPDIWMIEGYCTSSFFTKPPNSNIFIMRDRDLVLLIDTGLYPYYRKIILDILGKYKEEGAKHLVLMVTHGHFDHVANNDIILEAGYEDAHFLLPEIELETIDLYNHFMGEFKELEEYYNPFSTLAPPTDDYAKLPPISSIPREEALATVSNFAKTLFRGIKPMADQAEILPMKSRVKKKIGGLEFLGWEVGRFFAIHDGSQSPGHLSFYDPKNKLLLSGDLTLEINPPFFNSSLDKCIEMTSKFRLLAEKGYIQLATDSHRSSSGFSGWVKNLKFEPLNPIQLQDMARGKNECVTFYHTFEEYYTAIKEEVLSALSRLGEATVLELVQEFKKSPKAAARSKKALVYPNLPSRLEVMVVVVLKESKAPRRKEGDRIIFTPP